MKWERAGLLAAKATGFRGLVAAKGRGIVWRAGTGERFQPRYRCGGVRAGGLCRFEACQQHQVVGHHCGPDVGLEVIDPAPSAACHAIAALEAGDTGLDPSAEVAQLAIDPAALDHVFDSEAALFVEGDILHAARLGRFEIAEVGIAANQFSLETMWPPRRKR